MDCRNSLQIGQVVRALAGRDKGRLFVVVDVLEDGTVRIADGAKRKIEAPKRKKSKHLQQYDLIIESISEKFIQGKGPDNSLIRRELAGLR
jgi:ribosomal protein L14E/L6E/L27E